MVENVFPDGTQVPAGTMVMYFLMGRDSVVYPDPEKVCLERSQPWWAWPRSAERRICIMAPLDRALLVPTKNRRARVEFP